MLPVMSAPTVIPVAIASGKLNGETTAHTPKGRSTDRARSFGKYRPMSRSNPRFATRASAYHRRKSIASSTSATAS